MSKIVLFGSGGQLGHYLHRQLAEDHVVIRYTRDQLDLSDTDQIQQAITAERPDMVINASAYTAVDKAEEDRAMAYAINATAPEQMALACAAVGVPLIHYSTDYVFSGDAGRPYRETDEADPRSVYGHSKLAGEQAIMRVVADQQGQSGFSAYIFRTSWVYSQQGSNFYKTMLRLAADRTELAIVADQFGAPTYAGSLAVVTHTIVNRLLVGAHPQSGIYHMSCRGKTSWFEFAKAIFALHSINHLSVRPLTTDEYPTPAQRPAFSVLNTDLLEKTFAVSLPSWADALQDCVDEGEGLC